MFLNDYSIFGILKGLLFGCHLVLAHLLVSSIVAAQPIAIERIIPDVDRAVEQAMMEGRIPSMTVAIVRGDEIVWSNGYGYANVWARTPAVPSTVYLIGSTFKAMSAMALLQQAEAGRFELDDAVGPVLRPLRIRGENPDNPVTFRHLLTHTSGLPADFGPHAVWGDTVPASLQNYLGRALRVEAAPETEVVYSNVAFSAVGFLIEQLSGDDFRQYIHDQLFEPLEMNSTSFRPSPQMIERMAIPYIVDEATQHFVPVEPLKADVWPAGIVYGTVLDQANWLIANLNDGVFKGRRVLDASWVEQMFERQYDDHKGQIAGLWGGDEAGYGLAWWTEVRDEALIFAHSGSVPGYTAFIQGNKKDKTGVTMLTNGNKAHPHLIKLADRILAMMAVEE